VSTAALVLAAGRGDRLGAGRAKAAVLLGGRPLASWCLETIATVDGVTEVVLVGDAAELAPVLAVLSPAARARITRVVPGGATRQESCARGLDALTGACDVVLIHDAARPFADAALFAQVADAARRTGAALCAVPLADTLKRVESGRVLATVERAGLWSAQTPQGARAVLLQTAHRAAAEEGVVATDDVALLERLGHAAEVVTGSVINRKITTPEDLAWAEAWLAARSGHGAAR